MSKLYPKLLEIILVCLLFVSAWWYRGHTAVESYIESQAVKQAEADKAQQARYDTLAASYETLRDKRESDAKVIVRQVEKVVAGDVIYRNVCINDSGLSVANSALAGTSATSVPDATVQAAE